MSNFAHLPESLRPTPEVIARDNELARQSKELVGQITERAGMALKVNEETYNAVTFGADGRPVSRVVNGVQQFSPEEEAVARAQSSAQAEINRMQDELAKLTAMRDEVVTYDRDGTPRFVRSEAVRQSLDGQIRSLELGIVNQKRINERRWREDAATAFKRTANMTALANELEAQGRITRKSGW